jgi:5-formyltetrahydrofolate cyclo-ligase
VSEVPPHHLKDRKRAVRREALDRRDGLDPDERAKRSRRITQRVLSLPEIARARTVMAYWAFGSEVETAPLIEALHEAGVRVVLPRIEKTEVVAVTYEPGQPITATAFGAMEPSDAEVVDPAGVDAVIVPGVAFDRTGRRLGYGGGFFDRFLPRTRSGTPAVAIAFAVQMVEGVPAGHGDRRVDAIVTEDEVIRP